MMGAGPVFIDGALSGIFLGGGRRKVGTVPWEGGVRARKMPKGQNSRNILEIEELERLLKTSFPAHHLHVEVGLDLEDWIEHLDNQHF